MTIVPVFLDARPRYLGEAEGGTSLLLLPTGQQTLIADLARAAGRVTVQPPIVLPAFEPDATYEERLHAACPTLDAVTTRQDFREAVAKFDPSDAILFISSECHPAEPLDLRELAGKRVNDARMVRHLLAFEATSLRTKEFVQAGDDGRVRRIQRYFEPVTWPFPAGVIASLVPVACVQMTWELPLTSLEDLKRAIAERGIPSQDVPFHGDCFDLDDEAGALALAERHLLSLAARLEHQPPQPGAVDPTMLSPRAMVHATARLVGPVRVCDGAQLDAGALVIGPAVIAEGARVGRDAVVAQCVVLADAAVEEGATVRHRVVVSRPQRARGPMLVREPVVQRRHAAAPARTPAQVAEAATGRVDYPRVKAAVEPVLAFVALVLLLPVMAVIALLVRFTSSGAIFYGDRREGKDGVAFRCWKFRSMLTNANEMQRALAKQQQMDGPQFKMDNDPRVTAVGRWLRKLNVDELPQLYNVLRGEMSFVGPRPSPFRENQICVPWRHGRLSVRPGITGLWQVCRHDRALGDFHQWIYYDLLYVRNMSFLVDAKIFVATVVTLGGKRPVSLQTILGARAPRTAPSASAIAVEAPAPIEPASSADVAAR